jgi:hypothetical protein
VGVAAIMFDLPSGLGPGKIDRLAWINDPVCGLPGYYSFHSKNKIFPFKKQSLY